ncbi:hypothetical protein TWF718_000394 [Orbilia javanica]|uniref:Protein kinase domain-containing protein n=1 Tax=Orbilia javanica TaxID=47235 RepID=A0AAN8N4A6_9PEZI
MWLCTFRCPNRQYTGDRLDGEPAGEHAPAYLVSADSEFAEVKVSTIGEAKKYNISEFSDFKLIDLGTCFPRGQKQDFFATPKGVQAPELIFDLPSPELYDKMDIFTFGCTLYELLVGHSMFHFTYDPVELGDAQPQQLQVLSNMIDRLGPVPKEVVSKLGAIKDYINDDGRLKYSEVTARVQSDDITPLSELILGEVEANERMWDPEARKGRFCRVVRSAPENERNDFQDLLLKMMHWDAVKRPTAEELLEHPWFADLS